MELTPIQVAEIAKLYHEYYSQKDRVTFGIISNKQFSEYARRDFVPRYQGNVPKEIQAELKIPIEDDCELADLIEDLLILEPSETTC